MKVTKLVVFNVRKNNSEYDFSVQYYTDHVIGATIEEGVRLSAENFERLSEIQEFEVFEGTSSFQDMINLHLYHNPTGVLSSG